MPLASGPCLVDVAVAISLAWLDRPWQPKVLAPAWPCWVGRAGPGLRGVLVRSAGGMAFSLSSKFHAQAQRRKACFLGSIEQLVPPSLLGAFACISFGWSGFENPDRRSRQEAPEFGRNHQPAPFAVESRRAPRVAGRNAVPNAKTAGGSFVVAIDLLLGGTRSFGDARPAALLKVVRCDAAARGGASLGQGPLVAFGHPGLQTRTTHG